MVRRVLYPAGVRFADFVDFQINFLNYRTGLLIPSTEVWVGDRLTMRINSLACKGEELDPDRAVIGVFGDSASFGSETDAWPFRLDIPGYQALLTSVEGHDFTRMQTRFQELREQVQFEATIVTGSWHNLVYNRHDEVYWNEVFDSFCGKNQKTAFCTLPAGIDEYACEHGIQHWVTNGARGNPFAGWGSWPLDAEKTREIYTGLLRYNAFVRRYCKAFGAILIDLFEAWRPEDPEVLASGYFDPCHPRPEIYHKLAAVAREALAPRLPKRQSGPSRPFVPSAPAMPDTASEPQLPGTKVYPLW
ncbi:MAG: SGNH/GDSL hydrolase family protein [Candidatus Solibacter sp.]